MTVSRVHMNRLCPVLMVLLVAVACEHGAEPQPPRLNMGKSWFRFKKPEQILFELVADLLKMTAGGSKAPQTI